MDKIKNLIISFGTFAEQNHMTLIYIAGAWVLFLLSLWTFSILLCFWLNGLYGFKFELNVGISGIATIATAGATVYGIARAAQAKYSTDSTLNSMANKMPYISNNTNSKTK